MTPRQAQIADRVRAKTSITGEPTFFNVYSFGTNVGTLDTVLAALTATGEFAGERHREMLTIRRTGTAEQKAGYRAWQRVQLVKAVNVADSAVLRAQDKADEAAQALRDFDDEVAK